MILKLKSWCEGIIVSIILCIIIESLIPEGNNKKYVKVIIGIYIMYVSLNPLLNSLVLTVITSVSNSLNILSLS